MTDHFAGINDGDKVRVDGEDSAREGVWTFYRPNMDGNIGVINSLGRDALISTRDRITLVTVLRRALPPEPPIGSVVMDAGGVPWIRTSNGFWQSFYGGDYHWQILVEAHGPVRGMRTTGDDK